MEVREVVAECRIEKWETTYSTYRIHEEHPNDLNPSWNHNYFNKNGESQITYFNRQKVLLTHENHSEMITGPHFEYSFVSGSSDYRRPNGLEDK